MAYWDSALPASWSPLYPEAQVFISMMSAAKCVCVCACDRVCVGVGEQSEACKSDLEWRNT